MLHQNKKGRKQRLYAKSKSTKPAFIKQTNDRTIV